MDRERWVGCGRHRVREGRGGERDWGLKMGGWWVVSAKIKDQQGLMKDRVREGER